MSNVNDVYRNPLESGLLNTQGAINVLEVLRRLGKGRIIFASTVWVYMLSDQTKVDEATPLLPSSVNHPYTASKVAAEMYIGSYAKLYNTEFTILRYGIPYGPRGRMGTLNEFTVAFEDKKPIGVLTGSGGTADMVKGIVKNTHRGPGKIVYDSDPKKLIQKVIKLVDKEKEIKIKK